MMRRAAATVRSTRRVWGVQPQQKKAGRRGMFATNGQWAGLSGKPSPMEYLQRILTAPVYDVAHVTPLSRLPVTSAALDNEVSLKREDLQDIYSFKIRGAYTKISSLSQEQRLRGIVAASAGNHAQGVALSASRLGIQATICMPVTTPHIKVRSVERLGGKVVLVGDNFDAAQAHCQHLVETEGLTPIHPFDDPQTIAGQGTVAKELLEQDPRVQRLFVPVGGGGLAAGCAVYLKQLRPDIEVIGVEPVGSASLEAGMQAGRPVTLDSVSRFADGVAVRTIGTETLRVLTSHLDDVITVTDDEICAALKEIFVNCRAVSEAAGAVSLAGLRKYVQRHDIRGERLTAILSGANLNFDKLQYVADRCRIGEQSEALIGVSIPEKPGAFLQLMETLGSRMVTEFNYRRSRDGAVVFLAVTVEGTDERHEMVAQLQENGYLTVDITDDDLTKTHIKFMAGGRAAEPITEKVFQLEFPEKTGALLNFLTVLANCFDITLFHYRTQGEDLGSVMCGFAVQGAEDEVALTDLLDRVGYAWSDVSENQAYRMFLR